MKTSDVIECYVTDVAVLLPRRQRNDVAFELRALLHEGLQDRADATGRAADDAMAIEFLNSFGRPAEVAARYRPTLTIIDPADGHRFLRASVIGLAITWCAGLLEHLWGQFGSGSALLVALGQWWVRVAIPSLWWPGVLVAGFGLAAWARRRSPHATDWRPRARDRIQGNRATLVLGMIGSLCGVFVLLDPRWVLDFFWGGRAAPAAYEALTYTDTFRQLQGPWLLGLLLLNIPIQTVALIQGRWPAILLRLETWLSLVLCGVIAWTVLDGPIFMASASDRMTRFILVVIVACILIGLGIRLHRRVRPTPG